jgi:microsomal epoxide hydrolase
MSTSTPKPFTLHVPDAEIAELRQRLARTRWPDEPPGEPWSTGTSLLYMKGLADYWQTGFDWRAWEGKLNGFRQLTATVGGIDLHFIHEPGRGPNPMPLLISHGWPGSVFEFHKLIPLLTEHFTVVAPSLPGYALSFKPGQKRFGVGDIADLYAELMTDVLGYGRFGVQGGDWGGFIASVMGLRFPERVAGIHLNLLAVRRDPKMIESPTPEEKVFLEQLALFLKEETGYQWIQGTRPQTLAFGLTDSPAGLAAWIVEKFRAWTDCGGNPENAVSRDEMLANISLYWFTGCIGASFWPYLRTHARPLADPRGLDSRRAHGLRRVPQGDPAPTTLARTEDLHRHPPLERDVQGRPLRRPGAARCVGA